MQLVEYADSDMMMIDVANVLAGEINMVLSHQERVRMAVPGGTTPGALYDDLCAADVDWSRVDILLTDERWVPEDDERSNTKLVKERLLVGRAAKATLIPLHMPVDTPEEVLPSLRKSVAEALPLDLLVLGMGADMHVASIFPQADRLDDALDTHAPVLLPMRLPDSEEVRISMSMPVLKGAVTTHVLIAGQDKRAALEHARKLNDPKQAPISALLGSATVHWAP